MTKVFKVSNGQARGILERMSEGLDQVVFAPEKVGTAQDILNKIRNNQGTFGTRSAGNGFSKRQSVEDVENGTRVDFDVLNEVAYYTGDVKETNSLLNGASDIETLNVRMGIIVKVGDKQVIMAQADRLSTGDRTKYNLITLSATERAEYEGFKIVNREKKSWEQLVSIPFGSVDPSRIEEVLNDTYIVMQSLRDKIMTDVEESEIGKEPIFKTMAMFLHTKDIARTMIEKIDQTLTQDEIKQVIDVLFTQNHLGPMSTMSVTLSFTVTKVVRTENPDSYYDYDQHDQSSNALRSFINRYDVKIPINPQILVENSDLIEEVKSYTLAKILSLYNEALDPSSRIELPAKPVINVIPHNIAGITKEEFSEFQHGVLPEQVQKAIHAFHESAKVAAARKITHNFGGSDFN